MLRTLLFIISVFGLCSVSNAQVTVADRVAETVSANEKVLAALGRIDSRDLDELKAALRESMTAQSQLLDAMRQQKPNNDGTLQIMHPTLDIPVNTRQITAWYNPAGSQIKVGQVIFCDGEWLTWGNVNIGQVRAFADPQRAANTQATANSNAATQPFVPAPVVRGGR